MASVTWPLLVAAAPISSSRKVVRAARAPPRRCARRGWPGWAGQGWRTWDEPLTVKDRCPHLRHPGEFAMAADPAILRRIRACPFPRGGRVQVRFRSNGYSLFARRSAGGGGGG